MFGFLGMGAKRPSTIPPAGGRPSVSAGGAAAGTGASNLAAKEGEDGRPQFLNFEGWMSKEGEVFKTWKRRYFRLSGLTLAYYTTEDQIKGLIQLEGAIVRDSLRKNMELGFELVCNPSAATREGGLFISATGEAAYANGAASPPGGAATSPAAAANAAPSSTASPHSTTPAAAAAFPAPTGPERIYYLCLDPSTPPSLALEERREWMKTLVWNISVPERLRLWHIERDERHAAEVERLLAQVEAVRAEREMEKFTAKTAAKEAESALKEAREKSLADAHRGLPPELAAKLADAAAASASTVHHASSPSIGDDGLAVFPRSTSSLSPSSLAQREADATLISGEGSDAGPQLIAALKRKNQALEQDVRMILGENALLKTRALEANQAALAQATLALQQEREALDKRKAELVAAEAAAAATTAAAATAITVTPAAAVAAATASSQPASSATVAPSSTSSTSSSSSADPSSTVHHPTPLDIPSSGLEDILIQQGTPHPPSTPAGANTGASTATAASSTTNSTTNSPSQPLPASTSTAATAATSLSSPLPDGTAPCSCTCMPPCVPFSAHKRTLVAINSLENKYAAMCLEKGLQEQHLLKYKQEKKVLKQEVLRLRFMLEQVAANAKAGKPATAPNAMD